MKKSLYITLTAGLLLLNACGESESTEAKSAETAAEQPETTDHQRPAPIIEAAQTGPFEIKSGVITFSLSDGAGTDEGKNTFYFDNYGRLVKLEETLADGETSFYLYNKDTGKGLKLFSGRDKATNAYGLPGEIASFVVLQSTSGFQKLEDEKVLGKTCEVYSNNSINDEGKPVHKFWLHKGIVLKEESYINPSGDLMEAIEFRTEPLDRSVFSFPEGVETAIDIFEEG